MVGGFKHVFSIQLGMSSSQLTFSPSFFRGLGPRAQPASSIHSCDPRPRRPRTEEWPWVFCCVGHMRWEVFGSRRTHRAKWGEWGTIWGVEWELSWNITNTGRWWDINHGCFRMSGVGFTQSRCDLAPDSRGESSDVGSRWVLALKAPKAVWQFNTLENHHVELLVVNHQTKRVIYTIVYYNIL